MDIDLQGWFTFTKVYDEAVKIFQERGRTHPRFAELGVWKGRSLVYLAAKLKAAFGNGFDLLAVDTWKNELRERDNIAENPELEKLIAAGLTLYDVFLANMNRLGWLEDIQVCRQTVVEAARRHPRCDFAFIDANHSEHAVYADVMAWKNRTDILAGHDIGEPGVRAGLEKALAGAPYYEMPETLCWTTSKKLADRVNARRDVVMLGVPAGAVGETGIGTLGAILNTHLARREVVLKLSASSILTHHFNSLWCAGLNSRAKDKLTHFVMLHSDIVPQNASSCIWIDLLADLMKEHNLDVLSAVSPIKDKCGLTSTALDTDRWRPRRLAMAEVMQLPPTFTAQDIDAGRHSLLVNTGLMIVRLDRAWAEQVCFHTNDRIVKLPSKDGSNPPWFMAEVESEDWQFSRWCNRNGLRIGATREIPLAHMGSCPFGNFTAWGTMETDQANAPDDIKKLVRLSPVADSDSQESHAGSDDSSPPKQKGLCLSASP